MSATAVGVAHRLDARGQVCPYNLVLTKKDLDRLPSGERLEVWLDHPAALETIPRWARLQGHRVISTAKLSDSDWAIVLEKGGS
ncbi:MAG TPA: sulfurtransferase TusA family protein [Candidatus Fraserbacteria bacterium]|nr:sulfurtransferase TusA family protein [Candidatus Fraserbacteria bacterium]